MGLFPLESPASGDPPRRAVVHITHAGAVCVATASGVRWTTVVDLAELLIHPDAPRGAGEWWLAPRSCGWDTVIPACSRLPRYRHAEVYVSRRRGEVAGISVNVRKGSDGLARSWRGYSCTGVVPTSPATDEVEDQCTAALARLTRLDARLRRRFGVGLLTSLSATGIRTLRLFLRESLSLTREVAAELRKLDAYGGGRIELLVGAGTVVGECFDCDLNSAYLSAITQGPIGAEFAGLGTSAQRCDPLSVSTVVVDVPADLPFPPLRVQHRGHVYFPTGRLIGTWTGDELAAAERMGCVIVDAIRVFRFVDRSAELGAWADAMLTWRREAEDAEDKLAAKLVAVHTIGALAARPSDSRWVVRPADCVGLRLIGSGVWEEEREAVADREVLSPAVFITGRVRAQVSEALHACRDLRPLYVHTDGFACVGDPREALARLSGLSRWKVKRLSELELWAPGRRIATDATTGEQRVYASGISRDLTAAEVRANMRGVDPLAARRRYADGLSFPHDAGDLRIYGDVGHGEQ